MSVFSVEAKDIKSLNDDQLRDILRLLLDAEAKQHGVPMSAIRLGGDQNASDGGVDASVEWKRGPRLTPWFPARDVCFQSKAENMAKAKLEKEIAPKKVVRALFGELAAKEGAYIVFSTDDCSESMYQNRILTMRSAVSEVPESEKLIVDFYDASRIARWVNCFHGVSIAVLRIAGRPMSGWQPYENWSAPNQGISPQYLIDETAKVRFGLKNEFSPVIDGINNIRNQLRKPREVIRLIGVSGVGKTRIAQALFDARVGKNALSEGEVVYGDLGQSPTTTVSQIAEQLVFSNQRAILVVDNCLGETHRAVSDIVRREGSLVSLLTIDFDVGLDRPDDTTVIQLHKNGNDLIEELLKVRIPSLSSLDRHRVVAFADGNARVALAIANHDPAAGGLATLTDRELIDRLFLNKRRPTDDSQRRCAEVASLVYAFHLEPENKQEAEYPILAKLAEVSDESMYRNIAEFVERGTAQKRGTQRAILPQALAFRLATQALDRMPPEHVLSQLNKQGQARLFQSFTRQIGNLHESEVARQIASILLDENGMLGDVSELNEQEFAMFDNLAPIDRDLTLSAIERAVNSSQGHNGVSIVNSHSSQIVSLLRNVAYDPIYFERAASMILAFARNEALNGQSDTARTEFLEMFWLGLSWTQASPDQRFKYLDLLLGSDDPFDNNMAVSALDYSLTTHAISSSHNNDFGSRSMGQEWRPKTFPEQQDWFLQALARLIPIACKGGDLGCLAQKAISGEFRGLIKSEIVDDLVKGVEAIRATGYWPQGWKRLCMAMFFDRKEWRAETIIKIEKLEQTLKPGTLDERFETFVLSKRWGLYPPDPKSDDDDERGLETLGIEVGYDIGKTTKLWQSYASQACRFNKPNNCEAFGYGLAKGITDISAAWPVLVDLFKQQDHQKRAPQTIFGFIRRAGETIPDEVQKWLDEVAADKILRLHLVRFSLSLPVNGRSIDRLTQTIEVGSVPIQDYRLLVFGGVTKVIPPKEFKNFLKTLSDHSSEGAAISADILHMNYFGLRTDKKEISPELLDFGRVLLDMPIMYQPGTNPDANHLADIAKACLIDCAYKPIVNSICNKLLVAAQLPYSSRPKMGRFVNMLCELHPRIVFDAFLDSDENAQLLGKEIFGYTDGELRHSNLPSINEKFQLIKDWVMVDPKGRAPRIAKYIKYYDDGPDGTIAWSSIAQELIDIEDIGVDVLNKIYMRFGTGISSGPWSFRYVRCRPLLEALVDHERIAIREWAASALGKLNRHISDLTNEERVGDERFE